MALIPYINPGQSLSHNDWNTLYAEANRKLLALYDGLAPCFWDQYALGDPTARTEIPLPALFARKFYFFDELPTAPYANLAQQFIGGLRDTIAGLTYHDPFYESFRKYDHTPFTDFVTAATLDTPGGGDTRQLTNVIYPVARVNHPADASAWNSAVWPLGNNSWSAGSGFGIWPDSSLLHYSLEAHQKVFTVDGVPNLYYLYVDGDGEAEHVELYTPIDVFIGDGIGSDFTWPDTYNKYHLIRFQNLQNIAVTVHFPGATFSIGPLGSRCVRAFGQFYDGAWYFSHQAPYEYFFPFFANDPRWLRKLGAENCNITEPLCAGRLLPWATVYPGAWGTIDSPTVDYPTTDWSKAWSMAPFYGDICDLTAAGLKIGDLFAVKGNILFVQRTIDPTGAARLALPFAGMGNLSALMAVCGVTLTNPSPALAKGFRLTASEDVDLIGLSTNLFQSISNLYVDPILGLNTMPYGNINLALTAGVPMEFGTVTMFGGYVALSSTVTPSTVYWNDQDTSIGMSVTFHNTTLAATTDDTGTISSMFDSVADLFSSWVAAATGFTTAYAMRLTPYGPQIEVSQEAYLVYPITGLLFGTQAWFGLNLISGTWKIKRNVPLDSPGVLYDGFRTRPPTGYNNRCGGVYVNGWGAGWGGFGGGGYGISIGASPSYNTLEYHFPRRDRMWDKYRWSVRHNEPFAPGNTAYAVAQNPQVRDYFDMAAFPDYRSQPKDFLLAGTAQPKIGMRIPGLFSETPDIYTDLAAWLHGDLLSYDQKYTDASGNDYVGDLSADFRFGGTLQNLFYTSRATLMTGGSLYSVGVNKLPVEAEHYNAVATAVNCVDGVISGKLTGSLHAGVLGNIPGAIGYSVFQGCNNARPRAQYCGWSNAVLPNAAAWWTAKGATVKNSSDLPASMGTALAANQLYVWSNGADDILTGETPPGSPVAIPLSQLWLGDIKSTSALDDYRWVTIADAQAVFAALGIPFTMVETVCPASLIVADATITKIAGDGTSDGIGNWTPARCASWVNDPDGDWVYDADAPGSVGQVIRSDVSRVNFFCGYSGWGSGTVRLKLDFGGRPESRWYDPGPQPVFNTQCDRANSHYLYRNYNGPPFKVVIFPRNYAKCSPKADAGQPNGGYGVIGFVPRVAVDDLEGDPPEVTTGTTNGETMITTTF
jgi:hypothetical protein